MQKVALCVIGRNENRYAREFVEHHLDIGFDKIIIYDNNRVGEESLDDVLHDLVVEGKVDIILWPKDGYFMLPTYVDCYGRYGGSYDWILYLDFDEFLYVNDGDVHDFLAGQKAECVSVNWETYGDSGLVTYDDRPLKERFIEPLRGDDGRSESYPGNVHVKSFVRGGLRNIFWPNPHCPAGCHSYAASDGSSRLCDPWHKDVKYDIAKIKHYTCKTIEEWMTNKVARGQIDCKENSDRLRQNAIDIFFSMNERTKEKEDWLFNNGFLM